MSTTMTRGEEVELYFRPWTTFQPVVLQPGERHNYTWDEHDPKHKSRNVTIVTSEKVTPLRKHWWGSTRAAVRYLLNGHEIETHEYVRDGNFAFDLCPRPTPEHPQDTIGEHYHDGGTNAFTAENLGPSPIRILSVFIYQAHHRK